VYSIEEHYLFGSSLTDIEMSISMLKIEINEQSHLTREKKKDTTNHINKLINRLISLKSNL
jgi:hypothetical protein